MYLTAQVFDIMVLLTKYGAQIIITPTYIMPPKPIREVAVQRLIVGVELRAGYCASRCSEVVKVPATTLLLLAPQASPHGAAGEPRKNPCYYALKPSRTPSSWARFSVVFSRSGDLSFPIFTKPRILPRGNTDRGTIV